MPLMQRSQLETMSAARAAEILGDQLQAVLDRLRRIGGRRKRLEELHVARLAIGDHEVRERAAGVDTQTILGAHVRLTSGADAQPLAWRP